MKITLFDMTAREVTRSELCRTLNEMTCETLLSWELKPGSAGHNECLLLERVNENLGRKPAITQTPGPASPVKRPVKAGFVHSN